MWLSGGLAVMLAATGCDFPRPADVAADDAAAVPDGVVDTGIGGETTIESGFPSCRGLASSCGESGNSSCCTSFEVPGGTYFRSYDRVGDSQSGTLDFQATVSDFRLDRYEVTVGRFRTFVDSEAGTQVNPPPAGTGAHTSIGGSGWDPSWTSSLARTKDAFTARIKCQPALQTWTDMPGPNENRPINCVSWYEAMAFCIWDGGYLPTEAEWNYAATGGRDQRAYPWSDPPESVTPLDGRYASYKDGSNCVGDEMLGCAVSDLIEVGTKPMGDGKWGQSDLAGNVDEWVLDWYAGYQLPCVDCANLTTADVRAFRGGSFSEAASVMRSSNRPFLDLLPSDRSTVLGIRCAREP
jgi:formylglycine-generating enzyme required for sulfatase activity